MRDKRSTANLSLRELARRAHINPGYLSRIEQGTARNPSPALACAIDRALAADGTLAALVDRPVPQPEQPPRLEVVDVERLHADIGALVHADIQYGADTLHRKAARMFRTAHAALAIGSYNPNIERDLQAVVGELGEVAGWLLYDAGRWVSARRTLTDALLVSQLAGDTSMEQLQLNLLAMLAQQEGRYREALSLADRGLVAAQAGGRVAAMQHLRRGRALASLGSREGLAELARARALLDGGRDDEPGWTWWVTAAEVLLHEGQAHAAVGDTARAVDLSRQALDALPAAQVRDRCAYLARHLSHLLRAGAWSEVEAGAMELGGLLRAAGSARVSREAQGVIDEAHRCRAPGRVADTLRVAVSVGEPTRGRSA